MEMESLPSDLRLRKSRDIVSLNNRRTPVRKYD